MNYSSYSYNIYQKRNKSVFYFFIKGAEAVGLEPTQRLLVASLAVMYHTKLGEASIYLEPGKRVELLHNGFADRRFNHLS